MADVTLTEDEREALARVVEWPPRGSGTSRLATQVEAIVAARVAAALGEVAEWVADSTGYPIETRYPERPMPEMLWQALVDHVHVDKFGCWHGNSLDREDTESWLADEAGREVRGEVGD